MSYAMPTANLGDWVLFYSHEGAEPVIAIVQKVGQRTLILWALSPGYGGVEKPSVHHKDDVGLVDNAEWKKAGSWAHKPNDTRIVILSEKLAALEQKVEILSRRLTK